MQFRSMPMMKETWILVNNKLDSASMVCGSNQIKCLRFTCCLARESPQSLLPSSLSPLLSCFLFLLTPTSPPSLSYLFIINLYSLVLGHNNYKNLKTSPCSVLSMFPIQPKLIEEKIRIKNKCKNPTSNTAKWWKGSMGTMLWSRMVGEHLAYVCMSLKWYLIKKLQAHETKDFVWLSLVQSQFLRNNNL